jgi:hypothetical protein
MVFVGSFATRGDPPSDHVLGQSRPAFRTAPAWQLWMYVQPLVLHVERSLRSSVLSAATLVGQFRESC